MTTLSQQIRILQIELRAMCQKGNPNQWTMRDAIKTLTALKKLIGNKGILENLKK